MMDFPAYVPAAVRKKIAGLLEGGQGLLAPGFEELRVSGAARLSETENDLKEWELRLASIPDADIPNFYRKKIVELRRDKAYQAEHLEQLSGDVDCLRRLAHDERMRDAFDLLTREFTDDQQWRGFIDAAWSARIDFRKYREQLKRAEELKDEIADAAGKLAKLLRQFGDTGTHGPSEFYSITELLRQTESEHPAWGAFSRALLDDMAWRYSPDLPALLDTVVTAARGFEPSESGMIGAAIDSRQRNQKTEYLRAFGSVLTDIHGFALTRPIMRAIAIVANVVLNLHDIDATYDDVKKAIAKLGSERLENSGEK